MANIVMHLLAPGDRAVAGRRLSSGCSLQRNPTQAECGYRTRELMLAATGPAARLPEGDTLQRFR
jgi:hypothetical protein